MRPGSSATRGSGGSWRAPWPGSRQEVTVRTARKDEGRPGRAPAAPGPAQPAPRTPVYALNFYSPLFIDQLRKGRKTATIRLGDKSHKYKKGQLVWVTVGHRHGPRQRIFTAIIDDVTVKP